MITFNFKKRDGKGYTVKKVESEYLSNMNIYYEYTTRNNDHKLYIIDSVIYALYTYYETPRFFAWFNREGDLDVIIGYDFIEFENLKTFDKMKVTPNYFETLTGGGKNCYRTYFLKE